MGSDKQLFIFVKNTEIFLKLQVCYFYYRIHKYSQKYIDLPGIYKHLVIILIAHVWVCSVFNLSKTPLGATCKHKTFQMSFSFIKANGQALRFIQPEYVMPSDMLRAVQPHKGLKDEYTLTYKHGM